MRILIAAFLLLLSALAIARNERRIGIVQRSCSSLAMSGLAGTDLANSGCFSVTPAEHALPIAPGIAVCGTFGSVAILQARTALEGTCGRTGTVALPSGAGKISEPPGRGKPRPGEKGGRHRHG